MAISPFQVPLDRERDPDAWVGGVRRKPTWQRKRGIIDRAGFHALLRAAQLPKAELIHMGAEEHMLTRDAEWVEESAAIIVLGRIQWDKRFGDCDGAAWSNYKSEQDTAQMMGRTIIEEFFTC